MTTTRFQFQDAFKLALSMALSYWFALYMNWDMPKYSGLAVVLISLETTTASIQKGVLRIIGTIIGVVVGFAMLDWFAQDRLYNLLFQASYLVFISYFMQISRYRYAWFVAGFVPFLVWSTSYMNTSAAFNYGVFRLLETVSGITIFTIVSMLFWPRYSTESPYQPIEHDPERLFNSFLPAICYTLAYLFWIFTDPPGGAGLPSQTAIFALILLLTPMNPQILLIALIASMWIAVAPFYFILMPALNHGFALIISIFIFTFIFGYLGAKSPLLKIAPLVVFTMSTNISNQQTYSFIGFVNEAMVIALSIALISLVQLFYSRSPKPKFRKCLRG